jgi:hypothetical protein
MLTAICADFGDFRRPATDDTVGFRIQMSRRDTQRRLFAATENQGVAGSNPALGTKLVGKPDHMEFEQVAEQSGDVCDIFEPGSTPARMSKGSSTHHPTLGALLMRSSRL